MALNIELCRNVELPELHRSMCAAFSDYLVPLSPTLEQFRFMLTQRGYDSGLSWVAKADDRIVAFWLIGGSQEAQAGAAYVIATGTLPGFRGQGLSRQVFRSTRARLAALGKSTLRLEVIQDNVAAAKLYDKLGFCPGRKLICYDVQSPDMSPTPSDSFNLRLFGLSDLRDQIETMQDWRPSWQNSFESLMRVAEDSVTLGAFHADQCLGYGALLGPTSTVAQLAVRREHRRRGLGSAILAALAQERSNLKILNVDQSDDGSMSFFESRGAKIQTIQIEMTHPVIT